MNSLGSILKTAREARDLSQAEVARICGLSKQHYSNLESGVRTRLDNPLAWLRLKTFYRWTTAEYKKALEAMEEQ